MLEFLFNKAVEWRPEAVFKKGPQHKCFPLNFAKFLRTLFYGIPLGFYFWRDKKKSNSENI